MNREENIPVVLWYLVAEERRDIARSRNPSHPAEKILQQVFLCDDVVQDGDGPAWFRSFAFPAVSDASFQERARKVCLPKNTFAPWWKCHWRGVARSIGLSAAAMEPSNTHASEFLRCAAMEYVWA